LSTYQNQSFPSFDCGICSANKNYRFANTRSMAKRRAHIIATKTSLPVDILQKHSAQYTLLSPSQIYFHPGNRVQSTKVPLPNT
jgi:hypothetical protein